jgi:hypothetical protein
MGTVEFEKHLETIITEFYKKHSDYFDSHPGLLEKVFSIKQMPKVVDGEVKAIPSWHFHYDLLPDEWRVDIALFMREVSRIAKGNPPNIL